MKKKLSPDEIKGKIQEGIKNGDSSTELKEEYGLTNSQLSYYKKLSDKANRLTSGNKIKEGIQNNGSLAGDLANSINKLKQERQLEKTDTPSIKKSIQQDIKTTDVSILQKDAFRHSNPSQPIDIKDYIKFIIDGIEVLVKKNTKKIIIQDENVYIIR